VSQFSTATQTVTVFGRPLYVDSFNRSILRRWKGLCVVLAILINLFAYDVAADGTNHELLFKGLVLSINRDMNAYVGAYKEIDQMAGALGTAGRVKDTHESFVLAFLITKWSREFGFDPLEVAAVRLTESEFNPNQGPPFAARPPQSIPERKERSKIFDLSFL